MPRAALTMNGETETGDECAWKERDWRCHCWQGIGSVREETTTPARAGVASSVVTLSFLWQEAEGSTDRSHLGRLSPLPVLWLQDTFFTSLTLVFLIYKIGRMMVPSLAEL